MAKRRGPGQAGTLMRPTAQGCHVRLHPGFIDKNQPLGIDPPLMAFPARALAGYIGACPFIRDQRLFLNVSPQARRNRQTVSWLT